MAIRSNDLGGLSLANGRYAITSKLGEGGMGFVYRALDQNLDADVVIKIPRPAMMDDPEFATRFTREIRSLVKLSHPHIVKVSDVGVWEDTPFAVMQFLAGGSLEDQRPAKPDGQPYPCNPKTIPRWLDAIASALDYIHLQGYVHRDVKPGNILFDAQGHAFLSDFGVAKVLAAPGANRPSETAMTGAGMVLGTPEYMAPELIMGEPFDGRADQYALAVTVYELLCGRRPFENETKTKVLVLHTSKAPPPLTAWRAELPEPLSRAVLKGLEKDPNDRYRDCVALAAAVGAAVERAQGAPTGDGRVRFKCPGCGKKGAMAATDYARLRDTGTLPACPVCKQTMQQVGPSQGAPAADTRSGDTMVFYASDGARAYDRTESPANGVGAADLTAVARGGTTAMSAPNARGEASTDPEPRPITPRGASKTMIERPISPAEGKTAAPTYDVVDTAISGQSEPSTRHGAEDVSSVAAPHAISPVTTWVMIGAGAGAALLALTLLFVWLVPRPGGPNVRETSPNSPSLEAAVGPKPAEPVTSPAPTEVVRPEPAEPGNTPAHTEVATTDTNADERESIKPPEKNDMARTEPIARPDSDQTREESGPSSSSADLAGASSPERREAPSSGPASEGSLLSMASPKPIPGRFSFDAALLKMKPVRKYSLARVLSTPRAFAGQIVVPTGMFQLARAPSDHSGDRPKYLATERRIQSRNNTLEMDSSASVELDVEPKLAERLDRLGQSKLAQSMSILTLWFMAAGDYALVKVDVLEDRVLGFKKATHFPEGDVDYITLQVSPDRESRVKAPDEEWEQIERLLHFANAYKKRVSAYKKVLQNSQMSALNSIMGDLYQGMMKDAAARDLQQQQLRRGVGGR